MMKTKISRILLMQYTLVCLFLCLPCVAYAENDRPSLVPWPQSVTWNKGEYRLKSRIALSVADRQLLPAAEYLKTMLTQATGCAVSIVSAKGDITLALETNGTAGGYRLDVDRKHISISGADYQGVVSGIATLRQLLPVDIEAESAVQGVQWTVPCVSISDAPRFGWRGLMIDCSRHFFSVAEVKRVIDLMALYKLNRLHWHLTDDQGWRIEIKAYPLLTQKGCWRKFNKNDRACIALAQSENNAAMMPDPSHLRIAQNGDTLYGGFYRQDEIRDIVAYATARGIDVIPEVDMPGHSMCAIDCYPWLSCGTVEWRYFSTPLCLGKDETLTFCQNVWREIFTLFPSEYVHIGGDEVDMSFWKQCPLCQDRIAKLGLGDGHGLQAWFTRSMEDFFKASGKRMIGWDEILAGGVSPSATVMWWRGGNSDGAAQALRDGNGLIACPTTHFYYDYRQNNSDMEKIYRFALPKSVPDSATKGLLGIQGNIWSEMVPSFRRLTYMVLPRLLAEAETAWTYPQQKDWTSFCHRMASQYVRLSRMGLVYRLPDITGPYDENAFFGRQRVEVQCEDPSATIHYTTDGSVPGAQSPVADSTLYVDRPTDFTFRALTADGKQGEILRARYVPAEYVEAVRPATIRPGLLAQWYDYADAGCSGITQASLRGTYTIGDVLIPDSVKGNIGLIVNGYIRVPDDGIYGFVLSSDDGSMLYIDGQVAVDNDGEHSTVIKSASRALRAGYHRIEVQYFDHNGGNLDLHVYDAQGTRLLPANLYYH